MRRSLLLLILLVGLILPTSACPFCNPGEADIFSDIAAAQAVVIVQKVDTRKYRVRENLLGQAKVGRVVVAAEPQGKLGKKGTLLLTTAGPPGLPYWSDAPRVLDDQELEFARASLLVAGKSEAAQWDFAADHLQHRSGLIASAAYNLLAAAPLSEVQKRARRVGIDKLTAWFKDEKLAPERRALYLLMSYRQLSPEHLPWIRENVFNPKLSPSSAFLGPLAVAYLQAKGAEGVPEIGNFFYQPTHPASRVTPLNRALTLAGEQTQDLKMKKAVQELFRKELSHPQRGAFVLAPLALWDDYSAADEVESLFARNKNVTWVKVAVIRYFRSFSRPEAGAALKRLSSLDPSLVSRTKDGYRRADLGID